MRFRGSLTNRGFNILDKSFLPTLCKFGKTVQMVLGPEDVHLIMTSLNTSLEGPFVVVRLARDVVFERASYVCQSKCMNLIAFQYELKLLERVLRGAFTNQADASLEVKLSVRSVPNIGGDVTKPFLTFSSRGANLNMVQDLPITKPFPSSEVDGLVQIIRSQSVCKFYLDLMPVVDRLNGNLDKLKKLADVTQVCLIKNGDAHFQIFDVSGANVGVEFRGLQVVPETEKVDDSDVEEERIPSQRLRRSLAKDMDMSITVSSRQIAKVLGCCQYAKPTKLLCGIAAAGDDGTNDVLHFLFIFSDLFNTKKVTDRESMSIKIASRDAS